MKKLISFGLLVFSFCFIVQIANAFTVPQYEGFLNDYTNTLTTEQKVQLNTELTEYEKKTGNELTVVIIDSLDDETVETAAEKIFNTWKIGKKKKDNGVLFLISLKDRKMRIEVGYGLEGDLTDLESNWILNDTVKPYFKKADYYTGIKAGTDKIIEALISSVSIVPEPEPEKTNWFGLLFFAFIGFQWLVSILARSKSWWLGGVVGGLIGILITIFVSANLLLLTPVLIILGLLLDYIVSKEYKKAGTTSWWAGGGYTQSNYHNSNDSNNDSFGGFGGGSSGGGGSSSDW
jgi:uncharacterized protein